MPVSADGTAFEITGNPDGLPVVLIHGLGLSRQLWVPHLADLEQKFHVLNYDLRGHGESSPARDTLSLSVFAQQMANLMDEAGFEKAAIVGFSIGGMINRRFAMDFPDRVTALAILNSPHDRGKEAQAKVEARALKVRDEGPMATMEDALKRWFTPQHLATGDSAGKVRNWRTQVDVESYAQAAWVLANGVVELTRLENPVTAPTLVMTCENDTGSTPAMSEAIAGEITGSELEIIPGLQHLGLMENPSAFTRSIMQFLERKHP